MTCNRVMLIAEDIRRRVLSALISIACQCFVVAFVAILLLLALLASGVVSNGTAPVAAAVLRGVGGMAWLVCCVRFVLREHAGPTVLFALTGSALVWCSRVLAFVA